MDLKKVVRAVGRGEKGFTLIELLVVIAILGIIAAVVVLNIGQFMGSGAEEAANTEAHQVVTAAIAYMQANDLTSITDGTVVGPATTTGIEDYMLNPTRMQANYTLESTGNIQSATPVTPGKWSSCTFTSGAWACT